jgi:hypothetical protein
MLSQERDQRFSGITDLSEKDEQASPKQNILRVREILVESIRRVERLVGALYQARHLNDQEQQLINSQSTMFDKANQLMDVLSKKPPDAYQCFLRALSDSNQSHLSDLLMNAGNLRN